MLTGRLANYPILMGEPIKLGEKYVSGAEHQVWLDETRKLAHKLPHSLGRLWQKMDAPHAERDLAVFQEYGIPIVPTRVHGESSVLLFDQTRKDTEMVLEQPLLRPSHPVLYRELMYCASVRDFVLEMLRKGEAICRERNLGMDLMGGKAYLLPFFALNPFKRTMEAEVGNLLVAEQTIQIPEAWLQDDRRKKDSLTGSRYDRRRGNAIVQTGDIRLCDVRLFDFDHSDRFCGRSMAHLLRKIHEAQYATLWSILESFGIKPDIDFETRLQMMVRLLVQRATPKLRACAEEMG